MWNVLVSSPLTQDEDTTTAPPSLNREVYAERMETLRQDPGDTPLSESQLRGGRITFQRIKLSASEEAAPWDLITTILATMPLSSFPGAQLVRSSTSGYTAQQEPLEKQVYEIMGSTMTATLKKPFSQLRSRKTIPRERTNVTDCSPYGRLCSKRTTVWRHVSLSRTFHNTY